MELAEDMPKLPSASVDDDLDDEEYDMLILSSASEDGIDEVDLQVVIVFVLLVPTSSPSLSCCSSLALESSMCSRRDSSLMPRRRA